jgi:exopolysaccharide production protein ExoZ
MKLDSIQILRGVAALMVVIDHLVLASITVDPTLGPYHDFGSTLGRMGVNIFFAISGFIMVYTTEAAHKEGALKRSKEFMYRRITRLAPFYWFSTAIAIAVGFLIGRHYQYSHIILSIVFMPNFSDITDARMPPVVGVGWSLNYEMLFYIVFGACLMMPRRLGIIVTGGVILALVACGAIAKKFIHSEPLASIIDFYSFKNMIFFVVGIGLASGAKIMPKFPRNLALSLSMLIITTTMASYLLFGVTKDSKVWPIVSFFAVTMITLLAIAELHPKDSLTSRFFLLIGDASFSIYLFHVILIETATPILVKKGYLSPLNIEIWFLIGFATSMALGIALHFWVEKPLTLLFRKKGQRPAIMASDRPQNEAMI